MSLVPSVDAGAVDLSTAVSPSKIVDQQVDYGQSKTYKINAANKSSDLPDMTLKNKINIEVGMEDEYGDQIDCSKFVTIDKTEFNLAPENEDFVNLTISPTNPEELPEGNYKVYVDFVQQPIEGLPMSNQTNVIRVPLLVFIGNENDYNSRSCDFRIANVDFDLSGKKTTIINEIFDGFNLYDFLRLRRCHHDPITASCIFHNRVTCFNKLIRFFFRVERTDRFFGRFKCRVFTID